MQRARCCSQHIDFGNTPQAGEHSLKDFVRLQALSGFGQEMRDLQQTIHIRARASGSRARGERCLSQGPPRACFGRDDEVCAESICLAKRHQLHLNGGTERTGWMR